MGSERCRYVTDKGFRFLLPGCYGGAIYGRHRCTCPPRNRLDEIEKLTKRVEALERQLSELRRPSGGGGENKE